LRFNELRGQPNKNNYVNSIDFPLEAVRIALLRVNFGIVRVSMILWFLVSL
jgi:hypothetical protein